MMNERELMLKRVQTCHFALVDASLYLDSHPADPAALAFYQKHQEMHEAAKTEYVRKYGPLLHCDYDGGPRWSWVDGPWPWQNEEE